MIKNTLTVAVTLLGFALILGPFMVRPSPLENIQPLTELYDADSQVMEIPAVAGGLDLHYKVFDAGAAADEERPPTRDEIYAARKEKEAECERSREALERVVSRRRLYRMDENGERVYLDDDEIDKARSLARERVDENCG